MGSKEHNNWTENFTRGINQQTKWSRRRDRSFHLIKPSITVRRKRLAQSRWLIKTAEWTKYKLWMRNLSSAWFIFFLRKWLILPRHTNILNADICCLFSMSIISSLIVFIILSIFFFFFGLLLLLNLPLSSCQFSFLDLSTFLFNSFLSTSFF